MGDTGRIAVPLESRAGHHRARRQGRPADAAIEDYLKTIYQHTEWQSDPITPSVLASMLRISPASVTGMVKKLAASGLVEHKPYGPLLLTAEGHSRAVAVVRRHRIVETWLVNEMGYSWDEVHDEAEVLEHSISDKLLIAIDDRLGNPEHDPHGDPIPTVQGHTRRPNFTLLSNAHPDDEGTVLRISDRDPDLLRLLASHNMRPGAHVQVHQFSKTTIFISINNSGKIIELPGSGADIIWITASDPGLLKRPGSAQSQTVDELH